MKYPIGIQNFEKIRREGYARPFESDKRTLFKIGVNFSTATKLIDWGIGHIVLPRITLNQTTVSRAGQYYYITSTED